MIYTELTKKAIDICFKAHKEQKDLGKMPYVHHPFHLAEQMSTEKEICLALLHDVVEDTEWTLRDLEKEGFPEDVVEAVGLMTHAKGIPYLEYVESLRSNPLASAVKLADLRHNSTPGRLKRLTEKDAARLRKYLRAQAILTGGEADTDNMCLRVRHTLREQEGESTVLETVYEPDGRVRCYLLRTVNGPEIERPDVEEQSFPDFSSLLVNLADRGFSVTEMTQLFRMKP